MSQLTDSTSDSDSNSSSWVFIDENNAESKEANKYYLNCSSEPVQELTEKCLNSAGSEIETDSDGISVISESDSGKQILQYDDLGNSSEEIEKETDKEVIETVCDSAIKLEKSIQKLSAPNENIRSISWYIIFPSVLLLALIIPLFLSDDELVVNVPLTDCGAKIDSKFYNNLDIDTVDFDDIPPLNDCQADINCNSELHPETSKMFENDKADDHYKARQSDELLEKNYFRIKNIEKHKKMYSDKNIKSNKKNFKKKKFVSDDYKHNNYNMKIKNYKYHQYYDKEIKKRQNQLKKLEKSLRKKETELNEMKRQLKNLRVKINKDLNFLQALKRNKYKENKSCSNKEKSWLKIKRFNVSLKGDWYNNLYSERDKIRKQEQMANWIFERADMRSKRRDKAVWYFNWMTEREQLRFKKGFKQFSY